MQFIKAVLRGVCGARMDGGERMTEGGALPAQTVGGRPEAGIRRRSLHEEAARRLRALIQSGGLKPNERLNEVALAERFGISRTPVREAIKILATEGLLDLLPNRGARVAAISEAEVDETLEVIAGLEATAGELACRNATPDQIAAIAACQDRVTRAYADDDYQTYFEESRLIHDAIMEASGNATLRALYGTLSRRIQGARFVARKTPDQWRETLRDHERMVALLARRDGEALGRLMRDHVRRRRAIIMATFGERQEP
jgi:DNA-binding GntR family transcriptional regulator